VTPIARIPLIEICRSTITIFCKVKKLGVAIVNKIHINKKAINIPYFLNCIAIAGEWSAGSFGGKRFLKFINFSFYTRPSHVS
jgi:hypothetical protein